MSGRRAKVAGPCTVATALFRTTEIPLSRSRAAQMRKIAAMDALWQRELDRLGATMDQVRWVSGPDPAKRPAEVSTRYYALCKFLTGDSPFTSWRALRDAFPTFDPHTGEELPPARPLV